MPRVNLDEIGATGFDFVDRAASVVGLFYDDGTGPDGRTAIDDGGRGEFVYIVNVDVHVPEAGDEERSARVDGIR
jgi:hypothetical protein